MNTTRGVILSPHLDDAAYSLGAALLEGRFSQFVILNIFTVSRATANDNSASTIQITATRKAEDTRFFDRLRPRPVTIHLDHQDAPLRLSIPDEAVFTPELAAADAEEIKLITAVTHAYLGPGAFLLAPLALGGHIDHRIVSQAARCLATDDVALAFYEDLPYAADLMLDDITELAAPCVPYLLQSGLAASDKIAALADYRSQIDDSTICRIRLHGERLGTHGIAERLWLSQKERTNDASFTAFDR